MFGLFLLPLVGGFVFLTYWNLTRFTSLRETGYRLLFRSSVAGIMLSIAARVIVELGNAFIPEIVQWWKQFLPQQYLGTAVLAFLLGACGWWPANLLTARDQSVRRAAQEEGDAVEMLFIRAMEKTMPVQLTLDGGKVYIGFIASDVMPTRERRSIEIVPIVTGYRNEQHRVIFTTDYEPVLTALGDPSSMVGHLDPDDFKVVVPVAEVVTARLFDAAAYELFQRKFDEDS